MRCLFCGNELPVFKKLTGGGEFCSEAHRQKYQEEYNRLALSRLMQAQKPENDPKTSKLAEAAKPGLIAPEPGLAEASSSPKNGVAYASADTASNGKRQREAYAEATPVAPVPDVEECVAPAEAADFLWEVPDSIWWDSADLRTSELSPIEVALETARPAGAVFLTVDPVEQQEGDLAMAAAVRMTAQKHAGAPRDYKTRPRESRLELREFGRVEPRVTVELGNTGRTELTSVTAGLEFEPTPKPPSNDGGPPAFWSIGACAFPEGSVEIEFADWLQLEFPTTGIEVPSDDGGESQIVQVPAPEVLSLLSTSSKRNAPAVEVDLRAFLSEPEPVEVKKASVPLTPPLRAAEKPAAPIVIEDDAATVIEESAVGPIVIEAPPVVEPEPVVAVVAAPEQIIPEEVIPEHAVPEDLTPEAVTPEEPVEVAPPGPERATAPLPVRLSALAPVGGKRQIAFPWVPVISFGMHLPRATGLPMRPVMTLDTVPVQSPAAQATVAPAAVAPAPVEAAPPQPAEPAKPAAPGTPEAARTDAARADGGRPRDSRNATRNLKIRNRAVQAPAQAAKPATPAAPPAVPGRPSVEAKAVEAKTVESKPTEPKAVEPKEAPELRTASAPKAIPPVKKDIAPEAPAAKEISAQTDTAKEAGKALSIKPAAPAPPIARPEPRQREKSPDPSSYNSPAFAEMPHLGGSSAGFLERLPTAAKIGGAVVALAVACTVGYLVLGSGPAKTGSKDVIVEAAGPGMLVSEGGWSTDWTGEAAGIRRSRQISIYRPSLTLADYRVELQGQIEAKSLGIVYRANSPQNYYVMKLEIIKPGLNPQVALVRWAVINGEDGPRAQIPLPMPVRIDTLYKIRLDVRANTFTTYVLDQKVDQWTDDRIHSGGVGLINERGDRSQVKAVMVTPLITRKK